MKQLFPSKLCKLLVLILSFLFVLGLTGCSGEEEPTGEMRTCTVAVDNLDVHKKSDSDSKIQNQLPIGLEVVISDQKTHKDTNWGYIDEMTLPDGTKIKAGWIDLQYVTFPEEVDPDATEPLPSTPTEPPAVTVNMGTVTAGKLTIRKGPDSKYESDGAYYNGDRVEILETQTIDGTLW